MLLETLRNRYLRIVLTGVLLFALFPFCSAFADDYEGGDGGSHNIGGSYPNFGTVWYGPTSSGTTFRYGVVAYTRYDAAMYCLYSTTLDFDNLSPVKKQKLLAEGRFTTFADKFQVGKPKTTDDWATDANIIMSWNSARNLYGETYCYSAIYTYDKMMDAKRFVDSVLNDEGGGSGGGSGGDHGEPSEGYGEFLNDIIMAYTGNGTEYYGNTCKVHLNSTIYGKIKSVAGQGYKYFTSCLYNNTNVYVWFTDNNSNFDLTIQYDENDKLEGFHYAGPFNRSTIREIVIPVVSVSNGVIQVAESYTSAGLPDVNRGTTYKTNMSSMTYIADNHNYSPDSGSGGGDEPTEPPIQWPDPPEKPVGGGPDVPQPGDPTTPTPPDPVEPTPGNPWIPIPDDDIDITGDDFQDLLDALNEHCIHLQNSIQSNVSQLWDLQSDFFESQFGDLFDTLNGNFSWLGTEVIAASFTDLKDYLHQLFEWLADQMEFNINITNGQYNDSSVIYWLKQIWSKMGDGVNTQPTDPVQEPDDWWAWLFALMSNFVTMLLAFGSDRLADVTTSMQSLTGKFPFSLPWDLAALYGLLDAPAVIPEFDLPCIALTSSGLSEVGSYHITLEPYDGIWEGVRWVERIGFAVMLIRSTHLWTGILRKAVGND